MKQKIRTFVAVDVGRAICSSAAELIEELARTPADVKWVQADNLHLTLKFLGDVETNSLHEVCAAVQRAADETAPFALEIRGAGAFPNLQRPRTVWLGVGEGAEAMTELAQRIESALQGLGYPREARRFSPHLTIGRARRGGPSVQRLSQAIQEYADYVVGKTSV